MPAVGVGGSRLWLLRPGTSTHPASRPAYGLDGPDGIAPVQPTCSSAEPRKSPLPMLAAFPVAHTQSSSWPDNVISFVFSQCLNSSRHSCMFHTHSVITFVLLIERERERGPNVTGPVLQRGSTASLTANQPSHTVFT